jgi:acyl-CoA thioester hydrolase
VAGIPGLRVDHAWVEACVMMLRLMSSTFHEFAIHIESADIDFMDHVNNATYLKWVQAAVLDHWQTHAPADAVMKYLWVAIKHEITYRCPAYLHDRLMALVSLQKVKRESAYYETVIRRGNTILAKVDSRWCCIDAETLRPTRLPGDIVQVFFPVPSPRAVVLVRQ